MKQDKSSKLTRNEILKEFRDRYKERQKRPDIRRKGDKLRRWRVKEYSSNRIEIRRSITRILIPIFGLLIPFGFILAGSVEYPLFLYLNVCIITVFLIFVFTIRALYVFLILVGYIFLTIIGYFILVRAGYLDLIVLVPLGLLMFICLNWKKVDINRDIKNIIVNDHSLSINGIRNLEVEYRVPKIVYILPEPLPIIIPASIISGSEKWGVWKLHLNAIGQKLKIHESRNYDEIFELAYTITEFTQTELKVNTQNVPYNYHY